jgi:hypothetical protein
VNHEYDDGTLAAEFAARGEWLSRSLNATEREMRDWPQWERDAAAADPHLRLDAADEGCPDYGQVRPRPGFRGMDTAERGRLLPNVRR